MKSEPVALEVRSVEDAARVLEYFNAFHDSFIRQLEVRSHDLFEARGVQVCSGHLDLELVFAHYNYQADRKSHAQRVSARFFHVSELAANFSGRSHEWTVYELEIRPAAPGERDEPVDRPLEAVLRQSRWQVGADWVRSDDLKFRFQYAEFREL